MKLRSDFVTNSSSSSYVCMWIDNPLLADMLNRYRDVLEQRGELPEREYGYLGLPLKIDGERVECFNQDECADFFMRVPQDLGEVYDLFAEEIEANSNSDTYGSPAELTPLADTIGFHRKELIENTSRVEWKSTDMGWGGDHEGRFDPPEEVYESVIKEIADKRGCNAEDVSPDDFFDYVAPLTSTEESRFHYEKGKGEGKYTYYYDLD